jgi:hypothetical protein
MDAKRYLVLVLALLVLICAAYFIAVDSLAFADRRVPKYYKSFLLEGAGSLRNKIIIEAGSSVTHAYRSEIIENHFGRYTLNLADNAGFPLGHKLHRLRPYLQPGDVVVLPLEWNYYSAPPGLQRSYTQFLLADNGAGSLHYRHLPLSERLRIVYRDVPFDLAMERLLNLNAVESFNPKLTRGERVDLARFRQRVKAGDRGDFNYPERRASGVAKAARTHCDSYVFFLPMLADFKLSTRFQAEMALVEQLARQRQVRFVFVWPTVVDDAGEECYQSELVKTKLPALVAQIEHAVAAAGAEFVGSIDDNLFDESCFWDTNYHLDHIKDECAASHTRGLIADLESLGITREPEYQYSTVANTLLAFADDFEADSLITPLPLGRRLSIDEAGLYLSFYSGWYLSEGWGRWSSGAESVLLIPLAGQQRIRALRLVGRYFDGDETTVVYLNGEYAGEVSLIDAKLTIPPTALESGLLKVELHHKTPRSPRSVNGTDDDRLISYALEGISFEP